MSLNSNSTSPNILDTTFFSSPKRLHRHTRGGRSVKSVHKPRATTSITIWNGYDQPIYILHKPENIWLQVGVIEVDESKSVMVGMNDLIKVVPQNITSSHGTQPIVEITTLLDNEAYCFSSGQVIKGKCPDKGSAIVQKVKDQLTQINYGGVNGVVFFSVLAVLVICFIVALRAWTK